MSVATGEGGVSLIVGRQNQSWWWCNVSCTLGFLFPRPSYSLPSPPFSLSSYSLLIAGRCRFGCVDGESGCLMGVGFMPHRRSALGHSARAYEEHLKRLASLWRRLFSPASRKAEASSTMRLTRWHHKNIQPISVRQCAVGCYLRCRPFRQLELTTASEFAMQSPMPQRARVRGPTLAPTRSHDCMLPAREA
jgi:hypothetical protein